MNDSSVWVKKRNEDETNMQQYPTVYEIEGCSVFISVDRSKLLVVAIDPDWDGERVTQIFSVLKHYCGSVQIHSCSMVGSGDNRNCRKVDYNVFAFKYLNDANHLPGEVKRMFQGYCGIM